MAVVQISRIQARRGLQQDLPTLASAELGWSVDQRRLYIGNGTIDEGAPTTGVTEILTQYTDISAVLKTYSFKGNAGGYTTQTGTSLLYPTTRSVQDKLDDFVNVKDFGAKGDGTTDDTAAINRAITEIYKSIWMLTRYAVRRTIYFPAGVYIVNGSTIKIPPYARLIGDGIKSTIIRQTDSTQTCLMQTADHNFNISSSIGSGSSTLPTDITIEHMTLENTSDKDVLIIESTKQSTFFCVEFLGGLSNPTTSGAIAYSAVKIKSYATNTESITFLGCKFRNTRYALFSDDPSYDIRIDSGYISGVYKGVKLGENSTPGSCPKNYRITNTDFASVASRAIDTYTGVTGTMSSGNHFADCGNNFAGAGNPVTFVINYGDHGNYSIGDGFDRNDADDLLIARVKTNSYKNIGLQANVGLQLSTMVIGNGGVAILADNTPSATASNITLINGCTVNYVISRGTGKQAGTIMYMNDGSGPNYIENQIGTSSGIGVTLAVNSSNVVTYTTSSTGSAATLKYNITYSN